MKIFRDLNLLAGTILWVGLMLSLSLILAGLIGQWLLTGTVGSLPALSAHNLRIYILYILETGTLEGMGPVALVNGGIATLLLTPFLRILASMLYLGFREHDRRYTAFTGFILIVLGVTLFVS